MQTYKSQSNTRPLEWDITSSPTTVYHNYSVVESEKEGEISYEYAVDKMTHQEYNIHLQRQITTQQTIIDEILLANLGV